MPDIKSKGFNHVAIWVKDIHRSADWYRDVLGMTPEHEDHHHIFMRSESGQVLALFLADDPSKIGGGIHHIALDLTGMSEEGSLEELRRRKISLKQRGPSLSFQDPDGYWLHFA